MVRYASQVSLPRWPARLTIPRLLVLAIALVGAALCSPAMAQQAAEGDEAAEQAAEAEAAHPTIELGTFQVKDHRPTRNETAKVSFTIFLAMDRSVDKLTLEQLEHWKHRLRDQVIVAARLSETTDYLEPGLTRFRRNILLRVNRVLKVPLVSEVLLTEYTFSLN